MAIIKDRIATLRHHVIDQSKREITCHVRRAKTKTKNKKLLITQNFINVIPFELLSKNVSCQILHIRCSFSK